MADAAPQAVLVWSHGRSGSTLLLDMLASDRQTWAAYEPLQEIRERPHDGWAFGLSGQQSCRDKNEDAAKGNGGVSLASSCPLRDACERMQTPQTCTEEAHAARSVCTHPVTRCALSPHTPHPRPTPPPVAPTQVTTPRLLYGLFGVAFIVVNLLVTSGGI